MINKIREQLILKKNQKLKFRFNGSRNQIEEFDGIIKEIYPQVFIIHTNENKKAFSYSDILTKQLEIID